MLKTGNKLFNSIISLTILILLFLLLKDWITPKLIQSLGGYTKKEVEIKIDTLQSTFDTIYYKQEKIISNLKLSKRKTIKNYKYNKKIKKKKTIKKTLSNKDTVFNKTEEKIIQKVKDSVYSYNTEVKDTVLKGNISTIIDIDNCNILSQKFNYTLNFPKLVKETIRINTTKTEILSNKPRPLIGIGITANTIKGIGIKGLYQMNNGWQIQGGYERQINDTPLFLGNTQIKSVIEVGIFKTF